MLRFKDLSIRNKILFLFLSIQLMAFFVTLAGLVVHDTRMFKEEARRELAVSADMIGHNCASALAFDDASDAARILEALRADESIVTAHVYRADGELFALYMRAGANYEPNEDVSVQDGFHFKEGYLFCVQPILLKDKVRIGTIVLQSDLANMHSMLKKNLGVILAVLLFSFLSAAFVSTRLQRFITEPIMNLAYLAKRVSKERDYSFRGIRQANDEVGTLVSAFNDMLEQIETRNASLMQARQEAEESAREAQKLAEEMSLINLQLEREIAVRRGVEEALTEHQEKLEQRVEARTAELHQSNKQLSEEIAERKAVDARLRSSLQEKNTLLGEIHHRVRNNLQVISSLLNLTRRRTLHPEARQILEETRSRIYSMALVHSLLYESGNFNRIPMKEHIRLLWNSIQKIYRTSKRTLLPVVDCRDVYLALYQAIPCALLLNEAITNVFKHACQNDQPLHCYITLEKTEGNRIRMSIRDEGCGIPDSVDVETTETLGLKLMRNLARNQLGGEFHIERGQGTTIRVEFDLSEEALLMQGKPMDAQERMQV